MGNLGLSELLVIFVVGLLVIGPKRLPEVARGLAEAIRSFQDAMNPVRSATRDRLSSSRRDEPQQPRGETPVPTEQIGRGEGVIQG